jgi:hypothetical protein
MVEPEALGAIVSLLCSFHPATSLPQVGAPPSSEIAPCGLEKPALERRHHRIIDSSRSESPPIHSSGHSNSSSIKSSGLTSSSFPANEESG